MYLYTVKWRHLITYQIFSLNCSPWVPISSYMKNSHCFLASGFRFPTVFWAIGRFFWVFYFRSNSEWFQAFPRTVFQPKSHYFQCCETLKIFSKYMFIPQITRFLQQWRLEILCLQVCNSFQLNIKLMLHICFSTLFYIQNNALDFRTHLNNKHWPH